MQQRGSYRDRSRSPVRETRGGAVSGTIGERLQRISNNDNVKKTPGDVPATPTTPTSGGAPQNGNATVGEGFRVEREKTCPFVQAAPA